MDIDNEQDKTLASSLHEDENRTRRQRANKTIQLCYV